MRTARLIYSDKRRIIKEQKLVNYHAHGDGGREVDPRRLGKPVWDRGHEMCLGRSVKELRI